LACVWILKLTASTEGHLRSSVEIACHSQLGVEGGQVLQEQSKWWWQFGSSSVDGNEGRGLHTVEKELSTTIISHLYVIMLSHWDGSVRQGVVVTFIC